MGAKCNFSKSITPTRRQGHQVRRPTVAYKPTCTFANMRGCSDCPTPRSIRVSIRPGLRVYPLPYRGDLVRLATSLLVTNESKIRTPRLNLKRVCRTIVEVYSKTLNRGGAPYVLGPQHAWLYGMVRPRERDPRRHWDGLRKLPGATDVPSEVREALERSLINNLRFHRMLACPIPLSFGKEPAIVSH
jgi:hypothetical protein